MALVVSPELGLRLSLRGVLAQAGFPVMLEAEDLAQALMVLAQEPVELVLTAWELEDASGGELVRRLRESLAERGFSPRSPVVVLDPGLEQQSVVQAVKSGAIGRLAVPADAAQLQGLLENMESPPPASRQDPGARDATQPEIILARPRGFCAGVERAIATVEKALEKYGPPVYVKHAIVHNRHVVERLEQAGAVFVEELAEIPAGSLVIFSAHGVSPQAHEEARARNLEVVDATCPLVTKVHLEARRFAAEKRTVFLIGHASHVEVIGTRGEAPESIRVIGNPTEAAGAEAPDPEKVAYLTQTTLSMDDSREIVGALQERFPALVGPAKSDICYATQNRQNAVRAIAGEVDLLLVVGSANSSNSNRLVEVARSRGVAAHLVDSAGQLREEWLQGANRIGVTAGASAPEDVVLNLVETLASRLGASIREIEVAEEDVHFALPPPFREREQ